MLRTSLGYQSGFSLLEVLIAVVLAAGVSLGISAIQFKVLSTAQQNYYHAYANQQLSNLYEQSLVSSDYQAIIADVIQQLPYATVNQLEAQFQICWFYQGQQTCL